MVNGSWLIVKNLRLLTIDFIKVQTEILFSANVVLIGYEHHTNERQDFMSLEQATAFYDVLMADRDIYEQYYNQCCDRGCFGIWNWDKSKIIDFAANLGYCFTESELDAVWFGGDKSIVADSMNVSEYGQFYANYT